MAPFFKNCLELEWRHSTVAISMRLCNAPHIPPPSSPGKRSHRYATEVDFEIYNMGPLSPLHGRWLFHSQSAPASLPLSCTLSCNSTVVQLYCHATALSCNSTVMQLHCHATPLSCTPLSCNTTVMQLHCHAAPLSYNSLFCNPSVMHSYCDVTQYASNKSHIGIVAKIIHCILKHQYHQSMHCVNHVDPSAPYLSQHPFTYKILCLQYLGSVNNSSIFSWIISDSIWQHFMHPWYIEWLQR